MAKRRTAKRTSSGKCGCNPGWTLIALILFTIGLYGVAGGFIAQFGGASYQTVLPWYFIGLLVLLLAKMSKWKAHGMCTVHK